VEVEGTGMKLYRIKPLEWCERFAYRWNMETPFCQYNVVCYDGNNWLWSCPESLFNSCNSLDDGKRQAEAHYLSRLMTALEEVSTPPGEPCPYKIEERT
jgi:hypothetical protein